MTKKDRREMITKAMKAIAKNDNISLQAKKRGLKSLKAAYQKTLG